MGNFVTKDSGVRIAYPSGMVRDTREGKARFGLLRPKGVPYEAQFMTRVAELMTRGIKKYGSRNWELARGHAELDDFKEAAERHMHQYLAGEADEDHAAAVVFNLLAAETVRWRREQAAQETADIASDPETMAAIADGESDLVTESQEKLAGQVKKREWPGILQVEYVPNGDADPWQGKTWLDLVDGGERVGDLMYRVAMELGTGNPEGCTLRIAGTAELLRVGDRVSEVVGYGQGLNLERTDERPPYKGLCGVHGVCVLDRQCSNFAVCESPMHDADPPFEGLPVASPKRTQL